jgi:hypothetical protein
MRASASILALFFVHSAVLGACGGGTSPAASPSTSTGQDVSFSLPSDSGELVTVPLNAAQLTVLDFFGPTCEPCAKKVPALVSRRGQIEHAGARLVLVAVLADGESTADASRALVKWGASSPFLVDSGGVSLREAGIKDLPSTLVVDNQGHVRWRAPVGATADDVLAAIR